MLIYDKKTRGGAIIWLIQRAIAFGIGYIAGWLAFGFTLAILAGLML
jgi:hypothetical protein